MRIIHIFDQVDNETSSFACEELAYYLGKILDTPVVRTKQCEKAQIYLEYLSGEPNQKDTQQKNRVKCLTTQIKNLECPSPTLQDAIFIQLSKGKARIKGSNNISLLIAVYRLLSELGVCFFRPGRENEFIPSLDRNQWEKTEIMIEEVAAYPHRGVCIEGADSVENIIDFIDYLPKIHMNSFFIQFENPYPFLKRWYEHENNPDMKKEQFNTIIADEMSRKIDDQIAKRGLHHHRVGHGWISETLGVSSKYGWEETTDIDTQKREYMALVDGKRELYKNSPIFTSLCFSNKEARKEFVDRVVGYALARKDVDCLHVWLSDAFNNICECESCSKTTPSDQYVELLNELDQELTDKNLNVKICFLLYHELLFSPRYHKLNHPKRFIMMFAPISRTFEKSYQEVDLDADIPEGISYVRNDITLPTSLEENISFLRKWQERFDGDSFVFDYPLGRAHYGDMGYMKISNIIYRDIHSLKKLRLNGYISCQELRAGFPNSFPNFVLGYALWNQNISYEELKERYFSGLYGKYAPMVVNYLETISAQCSPDYFNAKGDRINNKIAKRYENIEKAAEEFAGILEEMKHDHAFSKAEFEKLSYHRRYVIQMSKSLKLLALGQAEEAQKAFANLAQLVRKNELKYQEILDVYRLIEVSTNYAGFSKLI